MPGRRFTRLRERVLPARSGGADRSWYASFVTSTVVHLSLIALLGCFWLAGPHPIAVPRVESRWAPLLSPVEITPLETVELPAAPAADAPGGSSRAAAVLPRSARRDLNVSPLPGEAVPLAAALDAAGLPDDPTEEVGELALGSGTGSGDSAGEGAGSGFFGQPPAGRRVVYVVDCSRSMNHPHASEAKTRFRKLKLELAHSILTMEPGMEFYVIFFNHNALPMPASTLQPAVPSVQRRYLEWVAEMRADGQTDPRSALRMALRLRPDLIYLLTDGSFTHRIERDLRELRQTAVRIDTICLGDRSGEEILRAIAEANGGEYKFVP